MSRNEERLTELLIERNERALTPDENAELRALLDASEDWHANDLDFAAAATHLALDPPSEVMPEALKARIVGDAVQRAAQMRSGDAPRRSPAPAQPPLTRSSANDDAETGGRVLMWVGWAAAAAAVALAVFAWRDALVPPPSADEQRAALLATSDVVKVAWTRTDDPLGTKVSGDVVWSDEKQQGFMRFSGLPKNDPAKNQYQLWVFDQARDERYPVDGGVFDINADTGEVIVPIRAKIPVEKATLFAVTLEKPGGVVVSTRERLVTLAKPAT